MTLKFRQYKGGGEFHYWSVGADGSVIPPLPGITSERFMRYDVFGKEVYEEDIVADMSENWTVAFDTLKYGRIAHRDWEEPLNWLGWYIMDTYENITLYDRIIDGEPVRVIGNSHTGIRKEYKYLVKLQKKL